MQKVLVTGSRGFIGKNLIAALSRHSNIQVIRFDSDDDISKLETLLEGVDIVFHLAGVNRPVNDEDFEQHNTNLTASIASILSNSESRASVVFTSSTQALKDNPYGASKKKAENILLEYGKTFNAAVYIYRLTNVFGKWCRPNYNSVVATFCHNISHGLDITISDRHNVIELVYIDDVIASFLKLLEPTRNAFDSQTYCTVTPTYKITLGDLADRIMQFRDSRVTLVMPDLSDGFIKRLYATYISYLRPDDFSYELAGNSDDRGSLTEMIKSNNFGQIFVSSTRPGVVRGNHYHDTKVEKFLVLKGDAMIKFRHILDDDTVSYRVTGDKLEIVDIPPGYTHSIENLTGDEMIVLFWADEVFDPDEPDTYFDEV